MPLLELQGLRKRHGAAVALDGLDLAVEAGEIVGVAGGNGAGKSTLVRLVAGAGRADSGEVRLGGEPLGLSGPAEALAHGIAAVYQEPCHVPRASAAENVFLGREPRARLGFVDGRRLRAEAQRLLDELRPGLDGGALVEELSEGEQRVVEIARALASARRLLLLDEPARGLPAEARERLRRALRARRDQGLAVLYAGQRPEELLAVADRVVVLRRGRVVAQGAAAALSPAVLLREVLGRELGAPFPAARPPPGEVVLEGAGVGAPGAVAGASFELRRGEILGLTGPRLDEPARLAEALFGLRRGLSGELRVAGERYRRGGPPAALRAGLGLVASERRPEGPALAMRLERESTFEALGVFAKRQLSVGPFSLDVRRARPALAWSVAALRAQAPRFEDVAGLDPARAAPEQALAAWLFSRARVALFVEPGRDLDAGGRQAVGELLDAVARRGAGVVLASADPEEIAGLCDRALVLRGGRVAGTLGRGEVTAAALERLCG